MRTEGAGWCWEGVGTGVRRDYMMDGCLGVWEKLFCTSSDGDRVPNHSSG